MKAKRFSIRTNEDYSLAVYIDGAKVIESITLNEAVKLREGLTRALSGAKYKQTLCRRQWKRTADNGYKIGIGQPLRVQPGVEKGECFVCLETNKKSTPYLQYSVEEYIDILPEAEKEKAREVFAKWL